MANIENIITGAMGTNSSRQWEPTFKPGKVFQAIPEIMMELGAVGRNQKNEAQRFMYRGIDDVYNALKPIMAKHGVFSVPYILEDTQTERASKSGGALFHVKLKIRFRFFAADASYFDAVLMGEGMDSGDKASNKAESAGHKYALTQVFIITTEDTTDADSETHEVHPEGFPKTPQPNALPQGAVRLPTQPLGNYRKVSERQSNYLAVMSKKNGWTEQQRDALFLKEFGSTKSEDAPADKMNDLLVTLGKGPKGGGAQPAAKPNGGGYDERDFMPSHDDEIPF